jgi:hypothetical protein
VAPEGGANVTESAANRKRLVARLAPRRVADLVRLVLLTCLSPLAPIDRSGYAEEQEKHDSCLHVGTPLSGTQPLDVGHLPGSSFECSPSAAARSNRQSGEVTSPAIPDLMRLRSLNRALSRSPRSGLTHNTPRWSLTTSPPGRCGRPRPRTRSACPSILPDEVGMAYVNLRSGF